MERKRERSSHLHVLLLVLVALEQMRIFLLLGESELRTRPLAYVRKYLPAKCIHKQFGLLILYWQIDEPE